ncbi:hypothetical protein ACFY71_03340 [Streptomyces cinerochromogenes]|uniref:hypothetical protein n=1 Tax=Streptomyces cinerochromogenes TaxID=66422 RepID=UPI003675CB7A
MRVPVLRRALLAAGIVTVAGASALGLGSLTPVAAVPTAAVARADDPPASFSPAPKPDNQTAPPPADPGQPKPPSISSGSPVPSPPGTNPCASAGINGIPASEQCGAIAKNQAANDKCQVEKFHECSRPISGEAQDKWQKDQDTYHQKHESFDAVTRSAAPEAGVEQQCHVNSGMRDRLTDDQVIVPQSSWWAC